MKRTPARISQLLFLALFLVLFVATDYRGTDEISAAVNSFFRADPLVLATFLLATRTFTSLLFPAVVVLIFTLLLGRFFCGWICPLGTILDLVPQRFRTRSTPIWLRGNLRYYILLTIFGAALAGSNLAGLLDPIALLLRGLSFFVYPIFGDTIRSGWVELYRALGESRDHLAPGYALLRDWLLPFRETFYPLAVTSALLLAGVIILERFGVRTWCRYLCPLGTLLGLVARFSPVQRTPAKVCGDCGICRDVCPSVKDEVIPGGEECFRCSLCDDACHKERVRLRFVNIWKAENRPFLPARRVLLGGLVGGLLLARGVRWRYPEAQARLLRPPGVRDEKQFLAACVRCGECMKVCLRGALYPAVANAGVEGVYTPVLIPRLGYCEFHCTLCGQVCPTGAIPRLATGVKEREVIGKAVLDKNHCLPFARKSNCIVCEEHCPIPEKAIRSRDLETVDLTGKRIVIKEPYVVEEICNGCGICEFVCPLEGKSGIEVFAVKDRKPIEARAPMNAPLAEDDPYR